MGREPEHQRERLSLVVSLVVSLVPLGALTETRYVHALEYLEEVFAADDGVLVRITFGK